MLYLWSITDSSGTEIYKRLINNEITFKLFEASAIFITSAFFKRPACRVVGIAEKSHRAF